MLKRGYLIVLLALLFVLAACEAEPAEVTRIVEVAGEVVEVIVTRVVEVEVEVPAEVEVPGR